MEKFAVNNVNKVSKISNELEYERATSLYLKLRKLEMDDTSYTSIRKHVRNLITRYENRTWTEELQITDEKVKESDLAEFLVKAENEFFQKRKELIKDKMSKNGLNQTDMANILGHSKGYTSELINGLRPFSKEDSVIINRILKIELSDLIPTFIKHEKAVKIKKALSSIPSSKIKLTAKDLDLKLA